ncbi:hypothetical protein BDR07DRAFT_1577917 [Suillus spraguei]|nr:hypothetical protein BDR07DRAFT_1577917 [Suillus spraguei]
MPFSLQAHYQEKELHLPGKDGHAARFKEGNACRMPGRCDLCTERGKCPRVLITEHASTKQQLVGNFNASVDGKICFRDVDQFNVSDPVRTGPLYRRKTTAFEFFKTMRITRLCCFDLRNSKTLSMWHVSLHRLVRKSALLVRIGGASPRPSVPNNGGSIWTCDTVNVISKFSSKACESEAPKLAMGSSLD